MTWLRQQSPMTNLLLACLVVFTFLRFVAVASSPPGFYIDEAAIGAQIICLRQSGTSLAGEPAQLFTPILGGGYLTIAYALPALAWTSLFGDSILSFRSMSAFFSCLMILGTYLLGARLWRSRNAGLLCALAAAISPWIFQFSRIAWDPSIAPAYLVWAFALLWSTSKYKHYEGILSGILFAAAAYCYPPLRVQIAVMLPFALIGLYIFRGRKIFDLGLMVAALLLSASPLIFKTLSGEIQGRFEMLSVFNAAYLTDHYGSNSALRGFQALFENFQLLLSPDYLFFHGDKNLRHSTGSFGIWSWLDAVALLIAASWFLIRGFQKKCQATLTFELFFVFVAYLAGVLPAAMTWESNPHALRSFGAAPFLALAVGGILANVWRRSKGWQVAIIAFAAVNFTIFSVTYFKTYPTAARAWFDTDVVGLADRLKSENRMADLPEELELRGLKYAPMATSYYLLSRGAIRCPIKTQ